jgi:hypothetical protein
MSSFSNSNESCDKDKGLIQINEKKAKENIDKSLLKLEILKKRQSSNDNDMLDLEIKVSPNKRVSFGDYHQFI